MMIPLWKQLQSTAAVVQAVQAGTSGTAAIAAVDAQLRPGVQALSFHVWRWLGTAQTLRALLAKRAPSPQVDALLCVSLSLMCFDAPAFSNEYANDIEAAESPQYDAFTLVDQTVEAAKRNPQTKGSSAFINACLRRYLREKDALTEQAIKTLVGRWNHPLWWIKRLQNDYPENWQQILQAGNGRAPMTLRVNIRKSSLSDYFSRFKNADALKNNRDKSSDEHHENVAATIVGDFGITLTKPLPVIQIPGFVDGVVSVQDAAAQLAAPLLLKDLPQSGLRILDACAAPGGKTAHLLEISDGEVTAMDVDPVRCDRINETLKRLNLKAKVLVADAAQPDTWPKEIRHAMFDAILLDAPCSASGIVRRHPDSRWLRRETDIAQLASIQWKLLNTLWQHLQPGGRLLYCTCSVFKAEGQDQIHKFLVSNKYATLLPSYGHLIGKPAANSGTSDDNKLENHDGFFYALLEKAKS